MILSRIALPTAIFLTLLCSVASANSAESTCTTSIASSLDVPVSGQISDIFIDDQCKYVYAANKAQNRIEVFSIPTQTLGAPIRVGSSPISLDASPDGQTLYVINSSGNNVSLVSVAQQTELRKIAIPTNAPNETSYSIAVAQNGLALIGTTFSVSNPGDVGPGGNLLQYDPSTDAVVARTDVVNLGPAILKASGDRSTIGVIDTGNSIGNIYRYSSASNSFSAAKHLFTPISSIALDRPGAVSLVNPDGFVLDAGLNITGRITFYSDSSAQFPGASGAVAVDPDDAIGYAVADGAIDVLNLSTYQMTGILPAPGANGAITISRDGTLLAVATSQGFSIIRAKGQPTVPTLHVTVYSTAQTQNQSFLRFYNSGSAPGTVKVTLSDTTGLPRYVWTSPSIPPGAAPQYGISAVESDSIKLQTIPLAKPTFYQATIQASFPGTFAHVLWNPGEGMITNLSTCDTGAPAPPTRLVNVHTSLLDYGFPSTVNIVNTGAQAAAPTLGLYDAATGAKLSTATLPQIIAGGAQVITVDALEKAANFTPSSITDHYLNHYVVDLEGSAFTGYLQHILLNLQPGITNDLTTVCPLPQ